MKFKLVNIIAVFISLLFISSCNFAKLDYYVSPDGDDEGDGSLRNPWKTINYAVNQIESGTLNIKAGIYKETVSVINTGSPDNVLTIQGEEGAIIDGSFGYNFPGNGLFTIDNASYINVDGITIQNALTHGFMVKGKSSNIQIRNCRTEHTRGSGILIMGEWPFTGYHISDILIENNEIHWPQEGYWDRNNIWQEDITLLGGIENFVIRSNHINAYDSIKGGVGPSGICIKSGAKNGKIYNNIIENIPGSGIQLNAGRAEIKSINVYNNSIKHVTNFGILIGAIEGGPIDSVSICYNTIVRSDWTAIACSDFNYSKNVVQPKTNIDIFNNTIYKAGKADDSGSSFGIFTQKSFKGKIYNNIISDCKNEGLKLESSNLTVTNNCIFNKDKNKPNPNNILGAKAILSDPQFVDPLNYDFSLKKTSPCVNAGKCYYSVMSDLCARKKSANSTCNIGAFDSKLDLNKD